MFKSQSGRSMIEMLGVLAIIGVLSLGGVAGYTMAMNKHKANEVAQATTLGVVELTTTSLVGGQSNANIDKVADQVKDIADMTYKDYDAHKNAYIQLNFKSKAVCKQFKNTFGSTDEYIVVGECAE